MKEIIRLNEEQLRKMVNESIKKKIMETMGINDEMESESSSLVHFIQKNIRKAPIEYDEDLNQNYHILNYDHQFENKKFHWTIIGYIYPDDDNFKDNHDVQISEGRSSSNGRDIFFGWIYFSMTEDGWFNFAEVSDSVYHEMLHLLKTKKAKKYTGNLNFINASNKQYNTTEGIEKDIAVICYMSREDELDAFINGLYGILKEEFLYHQNINVVQIFNKSPLGQKIKEIKSALNNLSQLSAIDIAEYLKPYNTKKSNLNYKKLMNLEKNTLKRLTKKTVLMLNHYRAYIYNNGYRSNPPRDILNF